VLITLPPVIEGLASHATSPELPIVDIVDTDLQPSCLVTCVWKSCLSARDRPPRCPDHTADLHPTRCPV